MTGVLHCYCWTLLFISCPSFRDVRIFIQCLVTIATKCGKNLARLSLKSDPNRISFHYQGESSTWTDVRSIPIMLLLCKISNRDVCGISFKELTHRPMVVLQRSSKIGLAYVLIGRTCTALILPALAALLTVVWDDTSWIGRDDVIYWVLLIRTDWFFA